MPALSDSSSLLFCGWWRRVGYHLTSFSSLWASLCHLCFPPTCLLCSRHSKVLQRVNTSVTNTGKITISLSYLAIWGRIWGGSGVKWIRLHRFWQPPQRGKHTKISKRPGLGAPVNECQLLLPEQRPQANNILWLLKSRYNHKPKVLQESAGSLNGITPELLMPGELQRPFTDWSKMGKASLSK